MEEAVISSIVDLLETSVDITENVYLMGYEALGGWILMIWVVLGRELLSAMRRPISKIEAIRQIAAERSEYPLSIPVLMAAPLQWLMSGNRQPAKGKQRNVTGVESSPVDLSLSQVSRLAIS